MRTTFRDEVVRAFGFLRSADDFIGPEFHEHGAFFYSPRVSVEILYRGRGDRTVITLANSLVGDQHIRATLSCLFVHAGLGPAQHISDSAVTGHALHKSLSSQAEALRRLLPLLTGESRETLMTSCRGR